MDRTYWHKQEPETPLFPELQWSRPENRHTAGKLLIVGGNSHGFNAPATAYHVASEAGIGTARVLLPDALQKTLGKHMVTAEFAPGTPSGSFSKQALDEVLDQSSWSDGVLLSGDFGRNSETAILLESVAQKYKGRLIVTRDTTDNFYHIPKVLLDREETLLVVSFAQLQKLASAAKFGHALTFSMDLLNLIDGLHEFTKLHQAVIMVRHLDNIIVADGGRISTTKIDEEAVWRVTFASRSAVWWLQHPTKRFEAITTSLVN